ncbi:MAG: DUF5320 domain-containing protein [Thermoplasmatota archaeon]
MPRGDRTGPWGAGPMTGRGAGYCAGYRHPGFYRSYPAGGRWYPGKRIIRRIFGYRPYVGRGYGRGFGRRRW